MFVIISSYYTSKTSKTQCFDEIILHKHQKHCVLMKLYFKNIKNTVFVSPLPEPPGVKSGSNGEFPEPYGVKSGSNGEFPEAYGVGKTQCF